MVVVIKDQGLTC